MGICLSSGNSSLPILPSRLHQADSKRIEKRKTKYLGNTSRLLPEPHYRARDFPSERHTTCLPQEHATSATALTTRKIMVKRKPTPKQLEKMASGGGCGHDLPSIKEVLASDHGFGTYRGKENSIATVGLELPVLSIGKNLPGLLFVQCR